MMSCACTSCSAATGAARSVVLGAVEVEHQPLVQQHDELLRRRRRERGLRVRRGGRVPGGSSSVSLSVAVDDVDSLAIWPESQVAWLFIFVSWVLSVGVDCAVSSRLLAGQPRVPVGDGLPAR